MKVVINGRLINNITFFKQLHNLTVFTGKFTFQFIQLADKLIIQVPLFITFKQSHSQLVHRVVNTSFSRLHILFKVIHQLIAAISARSSNDLILLLLISSFISPSIHFLNLVTLSATISKAVNTSVMKLCRSC